MYLGCDDLRGLLSQRLEDVSQLLLQHLVARHLPGLVDVATDLRQIIV